MHCQSLYTDIRGRSALGGLIWSILTCLHGNLARNSTVLIGTGLYPFHIVQRCFSIFINACRNDIFWIHKSETENESKPFEGTTGTYRVLQTFGGYSTVSRGGHSVAINCSAEPPSNVNDANGDSTVARLMIRKWKLQVYQPIKIHYLSFKLLRSL